jgi:iron complex outermembrane receptor protein
MPTRIIPSAVKPKALAVAIHLALVGFLAAGWTMPAAAQAPASAATRQYEIPAGPLDEALNRFALQAGVAVAQDAAKLKGLRTAGLHGNHGVEEGFALLLRGSGYAIAKTPAGYVLVQAGEPKPAPTPAKPADADTPPRTDSTVELAPMVVTATRTERRADEVPASVTVITAKDIATQQPQHAADLLRNVEGIDVAGSGSPATLPRITLRGVGGSFAGQTSQMLIDGMPIASPVAGIHLGLHALDLQDLEQVEVVRGPSSALYGPSAVGGVVNFVPKRWRGAPGAQVSIGAGSHDARLVSAAVGGAWDAVDFRLSASDYRTDGHVAQPDADPWGSRDLASRDGKSKKFSLTGGVRPADNQEITFAVRNADTGSAWLGGHPNYRFDDNVESYDLGYRYEAGDWGAFKARYRKMRQKTRILFDDEYYNGNPGSLILAAVDDRVEDSEHLDLQADLRLSRANVLTLGYTYGIGEYTSRWEDVIWGGSGESVSKSKMSGLFAQDEHRFTDALTVLVGGRWDRYEFAGDTSNGVPTGRDSKDSVFNPRLGARYRLSEATSLYATAGTAYVPALNFLKFRSGGIWLDNPNLKPETSTSYELGVNHRLGAWVARAALFHTDYEDKIASIQVSTVPLRRQFQNIGKVAIDGLELAIEGTAGDWRPYANYAYTNSTIKENPSDPLTVGKQLQRVSPHKLNLGAVYAPSDRFYVRVSGRYVDAYYFNDRNTADARKPSHFVADAKIGWRLPAGGMVRNAEISLAVNNLFDERYREQQYEFMDGRNVWLGLNARF